MFDGIELETDPMRIQAAIVSCLVSFVASPSYATLLFYEPFLTGSSPAAGEYAAFTPPATAENPFVAITGQNPVVGPNSFLTGPWVSLAGDGAPNVSVQTAGLSYVGAPSLGGSQISFPNGDVRRYLANPWTAATEGTYYISFLANFGRGDYSDGIQGNDMGYRAVELYTDADGFLFSIAYNSFNGAGGPAQQNPETAKMYLDGFGYRVLQAAPNSFVEDGQTHLIVAKFVLSASATSDSVSIFLDPRDPVKEPGAANAQLTGIDVTLGAIGGMTIYGGSGVFPAVDELRVSNNYVDALPPLPFLGDTNDDDRVDLIDYQAIISHMNQPGTLTLVQGDVTGDGKVTIADFRLWKNHRTDLSGAASESLSVPEPASLVLLALAACPLAMSRRRAR